MANRNTEFASAWLEKAEHDLITARQTLALPNGPTDTPCFHAQQAVEKSLKALLTAHGVVFPRTHDLMPLLDLAAALLPSVEKWRESCAEMSDYAVEIRYPVDWIEPERSDAEDALAVAAEVVKAVKEHIQARFEGKD